MEVNWLKVALLKCDLLFMKQFALSGRIIFQRVLRNVLPLRNVCSALLKLNGTILLH